MSKDVKTLVLLDAHAIIHRAYHALPEFLSSKGEPTGALYGLSTMLMKIIGDLKPDYIVACYDLPGKTFRHEAYDGYKAKRIKADEALISQLKSSRKIFEAFDIPMYDSPGFEADDILGTIVEKYKKDKDIERFGFKPEFLADYKGLRGDPSDNIIGIKGIGEKTATNLISNFGTIEEIYKQIKKDEKLFTKIGISPRILELIKNNEEEALFSKTLAKIRNNAPVNFSLPAKTFWENADLKKIEKMFAQFEFRSLFSRLEGFFGSNQ